MINHPYYPPIPEPLRVEMEPTNFCNANCEFCPRDKMKRKLGHMDFNKYSMFLSKLNNYRKKMWLNNHINSLKFPKLVFCGLGEPTLHPKIVDMIRQGNYYGFETELVTNGSTLTKDMTENLVEAGLTNIAISIHSLNYKKYKSITGLNLNDVIHRVKESLSIISNSKTNVEIWRVSRLDGSTITNDIAESDKYIQLLAPYKDIKVLGPTVAWNRGGQYPQKFWENVNDTKEVWCEKLFFTLNIEWDGSVIMCCCDYSTNSVVLGNAWKDSIEILQKRRDEKFKSIKKEKICQLCRRPKDTYYKDYIIPLLKY